MNFKRSDTGCENLENDNGKNEYMKLKDIPKASSFSSIFSVNFNEFTAVYQIKDIILR